MNSEIYEIERKFLVKYIPNNLEKYTHYEIKQGYISTNPTIRIRQKDDSFILTIKGSGAIKREEYELSITEEQFKNLWNKVEGNPISKTRYIIPLECGLNAELDIYYGDFEGFMNVEVEFNSMQSAILFDIPDWFGDEVTQDRRYSNGSLSKYGIPKQS